MDSDQTTADTERSADPLDPTGSVGGRSQTEVETRLAGDGFDGQFGARAGAAVLCFTCHREFPSDELDADGARRVEGESDPSDMAIIVPVTCPHCGTAGTLTLQYGPMAGEEESEVLAAMPRTPTAIEPRKDDDDD